MDVSLGNWLLRPKFGGPAQVPGIWQCTAGSLSLPSISLGKQGRDVESCMDGWAGREGAEGPVIRGGLSSEELSAPGDITWASLHESRHQEGASPGLESSKHSPKEVSPYKKRSQDQKLLSTPALGSPGGVLVPAATIPSLPCVVSHLVTS